MIKRGLELRAYYALATPTFLISFKFAQGSNVVLLSCYRKHSIRIFTMKVKMKSQFLKMTWMKSWVGSQTVHTDIYHTKWYFAFANIHPVTYPNIKADTA